MSLFELDNGRLVPAQFGHDVPDGFTEAVWQVLYPQVLQLIERPLFSVTWRDLTPKKMVQNSQGEYEKPALHSGFSDGTNLVGRLTALDAAGQVVAVVLARELTSNLLIESLSQLADTATLSWSDLAAEYPPGSERFRLDWADFRSAMPVQARSGPRLIFATPRVSDEVRPALDVLATSGIEVHEMSMRRTSSGRIFVECAPVTPRGYNTPLVLTSGVSTDTTMQAVITMVSESASRSVTAGGAVAGEVIGEATRSGGGAGTGGGVSTGVGAGAGTGSFSGFREPRGFGGPAGNEGVFAYSPTQSVAEATGGIAPNLPDAQAGGEDTRTGSLPSRRSRFARMKPSRLGFRNNRFERQQSTETAGGETTGREATGAAGSLFAGGGAGGGGDTVGAAGSITGTFAGGIVSAAGGNTVAGAIAGNAISGNAARNIVGAGNIVGTGNIVGNVGDNAAYSINRGVAEPNVGGASANTSVGTATQETRLTRMQRRMQSGGLQANPQTSVRQGDAGSVTNSGDAAITRSSGSNSGSSSGGSGSSSGTSGARTGSVIGASSRDGLDSSLSRLGATPVRSRSGGRRSAQRSDRHPGEQDTATFPSRRSLANSASATPVTTGSSDATGSATSSVTSGGVGSPPRLTRAQMRERAKTVGAASSGQSVDAQATRAYQIAGSGIETADITPIEPGDIRRPVQTSGLLQNAAGLLSLAQVLQVETTISLPSGWRQTQAVLTTSGTIRLMNGQEYTDPTMALQSLGFADVDGWTTWHLGDSEGPTLGESLAELNAGGN